MNEGNEEIEALMGGDVNTASTAAENSELESLRNELARAKDYQSTQNGRLRQQNEELARLRAELEEIRAKGRENELIGSLSQEERDSVPDEALSAAAKMIDKRFSTVNERLEDIEKRRAREEAVSFYAAIDREFPGWRSSVGPGGDKNAAWTVYLSKNAASVRQALMGGDIDSVRYHVQNFYKNTLGIPAPSGTGYPAVSDPSSYGGGNAPNQSLNVGDSELNALFDRKEAARDRGDYAEASRLGNEIERIMRSRGM